MTTTSTEAKAPAIAKKETKAQPTIMNMIQTMEPQIKRALPNTITPERFTRIATTALSSNPTLKKCTPMSFIGAMMTAAQLGLEPNTPLGEAYLIPRKNRKNGTMEVQFQTGYKGLLKLAHNFGLNVTAHEVYENDELIYEYGLHEDLIHRPVMKDRGKVIAYYATWTKGEQSGFLVLSKEDIEAYAKKYSDAYNSGFSPWTTNFDSMAKKTVIKQLLKYAPLSTDLVHQLSNDETIKDKISDDMADVEDTTDWDDVIDVTEDVEEHPDDTEE